MQPLQKIFHDLIIFRNQMNLGLSKDDVKYIWGRKALKSFKKVQDYENEIVLKKTKLAKENISKLKVFNWVKFIGISGSVAAGFAKEEDDIDMFVVVRNGTMWIYRALIVFRNLFHNRIRAKRHKNVKDRLCVNIICEERGLLFPNDIFNFHELMFLKPIYNREYKKYILAQNEWLREEFRVKKELLRTRIIAGKKAFILIRAINYLAFLAQVLFMFIAKHDPDISRIKRNFRKGRIEFFENNYRK